ncbi:hypothetical protein [Leucobacter soli]
MTATYVVPVVLATRRPALSTLTTPGFDDEYVTFTPVARLDEYVPVM